MLKLLSSFELQHLPISEQAILGCLSDRLSIREIVTLYFSGIISKTYTDSKLDYFKNALTNELISACQNHEIEYAGDINGWVYADSNPYPLARNGDFVPLTRYIIPHTHSMPHIDYIDIKPNIFSKSAEIKQVSKDKRPTSETKVDHFCCMPSDCTIHKAEMKRYLERKGAWPVGDRLLAKWWNQDSAPSKVISPKKDIENASCDADQGRREKQIEKILSVIECLGFNTLDIPKGTKNLIKAECLKDSSLFTDSGFGHAWRAANKQKRIRVQNKEDYY